MRTLIDLLLDHGVLLLFAVTLAARIGVPVPAAPLLVVAGGLAAAGHLSGWAAFGASVLANLIGDGVWFQAGRKYGYRVLRLLCRISISPDSCVIQSESLISRWGGSSLIAAKFAPGVSVVAAPMAGALGMSKLRFLSYDLLAGALWSGVFLALGLILSEQIEQTLNVLADAGLVASIALVSVVAALLARRIWHRRRLMRGANSARITVDETLALIESGAKPILVDVRAESSRQVDPRSIPGSLLLDSFQKGGGMSAVLPPDSVLVLYCNCPNEVSAMHAVEALTRQGFTGARALTGGLDAWAVAGRPFANS